MSQAIKQELIRTNSTWYHFIGKQYSKSKFIKEARKHGVSRRVPSTVARGMNFGDKVILLRWKGKETPPVAFAEMTIAGITLMGGIANQVGEKLKEEGRAEYEEGGGIVNRECGMYILMGRWSTDASMSEILDIADQMAAETGEKLFVMIAGRLSDVYSDEVTPHPAPNFTRGFTKLKEEPIFHLWSEPEDTGEILAIRNYQRA